MRIPWTSDFAVNLNRHLAIRQCNDASFERQMLYPKRGYETRGHSIVNNLWHQKPCLLPHKAFAPETSLSHKAFPTANWHVLPATSDTKSLWHHKVSTPQTSYHSYNTKRSHQQPFELEALFHRPKGFYTIKKFQPNGLTPETFYTRSQLNPWAFARTKCCLRHKAFYTKSVLQVLHFYGAFTELLRSL